MSIYFLKSSRLGFRAWTAEDLPLAMRLWSDEKVTRYIDARSKLTASQVEERLFKEIRIFSEYGVQYWPLFLLEGNVFIGCCGLRPYKSEQKRYELGVHICAGQWGHGYASEAGSAVIEYAFTGLSAKSLFAGHHPQNEVSRHLLQKIGFRYTHDEFFPPTGLMHPSYLMTAEKFVQAKQKDKLIF